MANAKTETVTKKVETEVEEKVYNLVLTEDEARTLRALLGSIYGSDRDTYNKHTYAMWEALMDSGAPFTPFSSRFAVNGTRVTAKEIKN